MVGICCTPPCTFVCPHTFVCPLYICTPHAFIWPLGVYTPPGAPHVSVLLHGFGTLHVVGGCFSVLCVLGHTTPIWGCLPLYYTPHTLLLVLCALLFSGISVLMWAFSPFFWRVWGCSPHHWGRLGWHIGSCSHAHSVTPFFVVHYVSCLNHGSDYYSSNYSGIFWPVISVVSISGSFSDRVSSKHFYS